MLAYFSLTLPFKVYIYDIKDSLIVWKVQKMLKLD